MRATAGSPMLRPAAPADLPRLLAIRDASGADALSEPALVTEPALRQLVSAGAVIVCDEGGLVVGFAAADGPAIHLLVDSAARGKGVGRELLAAACGRVRQAGHDAARLTTAPGGLAERHYRAAGWIEAERGTNGGLVLKKPL
jgi:GNAT superfamily N-acetyltransferase